ncbi:hypothetical protein GCM10023232_26760 [Sphingosinicella ginsenosidimutans]|uniref:Restriction alleviation protein, Lar family n=1 Tax=Allosphingosinicella ginsenosidimutans TaxID=1176539 RepID=A0A5C6TUB5_9SPHN|nr:hypothetical protein [Sphingosinicella ginsenosidimutans]TXC63710.1 hypothetical protein FRZ32_08585 [Sphingosinicella ginsenosidimutans]
MSDTISDKARELLPCPFCGGEMIFRKALWPADGCTDAVIHRDPVECGLTVFDTDSADESVIPAWNARALTPSPSPGEVVERLLNPWQASRDRVERGMLPDWSLALLREAASRIQADARRIEEMESALRPFVAHAGPRLPDGHHDLPRFPAADIDRARAALAAADPAPEGGEE